MNFREFSEKLISFETDLATRDNVSEYLRKLEKGETYPNGRTVADCELSGAWTLRSGDIWGRAVVIIKYDPEENTPLCVESLVDGSKDYCTFEYFLETVFLSICDDVIIDGNHYDLNMMFKTKASVGNDNQASEVVEQDYEGCAVPADWKPWVL